MAQADLRAHLVSHSSVTVTWWHPQSSTQETSAWWGGHGRRRVEASTEVKLVSLASEKGKQCLFHLQYSAKAP